MMRIGLLIFGVISVALLAKAEVVIVYDDQWAKESPHNRWLVNNAVETAERWMRRLRMPYRRIKASVMTKSDIQTALCLLPLGYPSSSLVSKVCHAQRFVVLTSESDQVELWRQAIAKCEIKEQGRWCIIAQPFDQDTLDRKRAEQVSEWLLEDTKLHFHLIRELRNRWKLWRTELMRKRQVWQKEILRRKFFDLNRKMRALSLFQPPVKAVNFSLTSSGTVWLNRLRVLLREHERIHTALSISLEPMENEIRGVWLHTYEPTDWDKVMKTLKDANFNCLFFRVGRGGNVVYKSKFLPRDPWAETADLDELKNACTFANLNGIELHAWRVNFHFGTAPEPLKQEMAREDRLVRDPDEKQELWLNPADPRNQEHEFQAMMELLNYPIAGVHFDYIRYPETPHYNFDYSQVSRKEFEKDVGLSLKDFPRQILFGPLKILYDDWQRDNITDLVRRVYLNVKEANPKVVVSAAVWQRHRYYFSLIKQDWMRWVNEGILDFVCPMDYSANNEFFTENVQQQVLEVNGKIPIAIGIGAYLMDEEWQLVEQVKIARDLGADGFIVFSYNVSNIKDFLSALTLGATSKPTEPTYRASGISFHLTGGIRSKDMPVVFRTGDNIRVAVVVTKSLFQNDVKKIRMTLHLEKQGGFSDQIIWKGNLSFTEPAKIFNFNPFMSRSSLGYRNQVIKCTIKVPRGTARLVGRGVITFENGKRKSFVRRGPFIKGVSSKEISGLIASLLPPQLPMKAKKSKLPIIGILTEGIGSQKLAEILHRKGLDVLPVRVFENTYWKPADIFIISPLLDLRELTYQRAQALHRWVKNGGKLILLSEACGYYGHANLFPEVAIVTGDQAITSITNFRQTLKLNALALTLKPNKGSGLWHADGKVIIASGNVGKGLVVMCGVRIPSKNDDTAWQNWKRLITILVRIALKKSSSK